MSIKVILDTFSSCFFLLLKIKIFSIFLVWYGVPFGLPKRKPWDRGPLAPLNLPLTGRCGLESYTLHNPTLTMMKATERHFIKVHTSTKKLEDSALVPGCLEIEYFTGNFAFWGSCKSACDQRLPFLESCIGKAMVAYAKPQQ